MLHFEMELAEHSVILITLIFGVFFWVAVISAIALVMVADRIIDEILSDNKDKQQAELDEDT